jgi:putrescine aminotransferase
MRDEALGAAVAERLYEKRVLVAYALNRPRVIRVEPPLNIPENLLDRLVEALDTALPGLKA